MTIYAETGNGFNDCVVFKDSRPTQRTFLPSQFMFSPV